MVRVLCAFALLVLAGCADGLQSVRPADGTQPALRTRRHTVHVVVKMSFPYRNGHRRSHDRRSPLYISQYTSTVEVTFAGGPTAFSHTYAVTPGTGSCPTSGGSTTCSWTAAVAPGTYGVTIVARDAAANVLSQTKSVPSVVAAGENNVLRFTMYGVPTGLGVFLVANGSPGSSSGWFGNIYDLGAPLSFSVYPYGVTEGGHVQVITGAGTPQIVATQTSGSLDVALTPATGDPPTFTVSAPAGANLGVATVQVSATFPASGADICSLPGAVCTATPLTFSGQELVAVCCANGVQLYGIGGGGPLKTIGSATSAFTAFAFDAQNDIFVTTANGVSEYTPPYSGAAAATITTGINGAVAIAVSDDGKLFVANASASPQSITEYIAPFANASPAATITQGIALPTPPANAPALSIDNGSTQTDTLAVATSAGVQTYAPPYTAAPVAIGNALNDFLYNPFGTPYGLTTSGVAFCVSTCDANLAAVSGGYALALPSPTNTAGAQFAYVASTDGHVYAFNLNGTTPLTLAPDLSMQPQLMPENIASDPHGNLAIVDYEGNSVTVYTGVTAVGPATPAFNGTPVTLTTSILHPSQVQILP
jgi:hypothetical protein